MLNIDNPVLPLVAYRLGLVTLGVGTVFRFLDPDRVAPITTLTVVMAPIGLLIGFWLLRACYRGSRPVAWFFIIVLPMSWPMALIWPNRMQAVTTLGLTTMIVQAVCELTLSVTTLRKTKLKPAPEETN